MKGNVVRTWVVNEEQKLYSTNVGMYVMYTMYIKNIINLLLNIKYEDPKLRRILSFTLCT